MFVVKIIGSFVTSWKSHKSDRYGFIAAPPPQKLSNPICAYECVDIDLPHSERTCRPPQNTGQYWHREEVVIILRVVESPIRVLASFELISGWQW